MSIQVCRCFQKQTCMLFFYNFSRAEDTILKKQVAIKKLSRPFQSHEHAKRTYREINLLHFIASENVSNVIVIFFQTYPVRLYTHARDYNMAQLLLFLICIHCMNGAPSTTGHESCGHWLRVSCAGFFFRRAGGRTPPPPGIDFFPPEIFDKKRGFFSHVKWHVFRVKYRLISLFTPWKKPEKNPA